MREKARSEAIRKVLLGWFRGAKRDLPWRSTRDPYRIWVSEVMLQQTTVPVVRERFPLFLERFPDAFALARASEEEVLAAWSGLGYYSRARALHRAARIVAAEHGGRVPADPDAFRALPGVGPYTAGAVLSIAFGLPEPLVDGNAARVLCRLFALEGDPASAAVRKKLWSLARELLSRRRPGDFNQALMEFGALVCTPRSPDCAACPLKSACRAFARGAAGRIPGKKKGPDPQRILLAGALIRRRGRILLVRRDGEQRLLRGLWLFPGGEVKSPGEGPRLLSRLCRGLLGASLRVEREPAAALNHSITRYRIRFLLFPGTVEGRPRPLRNRTAARWVRPGEVGSLPTSSLVTKALSGPIHKYDDL